MSGSALAVVLSLSSASVHPYPVREPIAFSGAQALSDDQLGEVRGTQAISFSGERGALPRLTRDPVVRELMIPRSAMEQQFDNWFNEIGAQLIYDNLTR